ncbi:MAG TPA: neutral zinc metallopeptidase [Mycobacteriales bacterium]|nr:neutral zinc metallopeptidase [Mycobacteriales bacterium]
MRVLCGIGLATVLVVVAGCSTGGRRAAAPGTASAPSRPAATTPPASPCSGRPGDAKLARCLQGMLTDVWSARFTEVARSYRPPRLVAPDPARHTGRQAAYISSRAFYQSGTIHLPTGYLAAVHARFGTHAPGVVAFAMAHETGHHVQELLGVFAPANARALNSNDSSRRVETQADCFAGVWAHAEAEAGRLDRSRFAAAARVEVSRLSTDTAGGAIDPSVEVRTHGRVAERMRWLTRGLDSGDPGRCDTFAGSRVTVRLPWDMAANPGRAPGQVGVSPTARRWDQRSDGLGRTGTARPHRAVSAALLRVNPADTARPRRVPVTTARCGPPYTWADTLPGLTGANRSAPECRSSHAATGSGCPPDGGSQRSE